MLAWRTIEVREETPEAKIVEKGGKAMKRKEGSHILGGNEGLERWMDGGDRWVGMNVV